MANLKAIITKNVGTTLTAAYTNTSGADAALKAYNANTNTDLVETTATESDWTFLGDSYRPAGGSEGFGNAHPIKLSANRVLLLWTQKNISNSSTDPGTDASDNIIYAQIVEYQTDKYVAGPITLINSANVWGIVSGTQFGVKSLPPLFANGNGQIPFIHGVALTPTKVVVATSATVSSTAKLLNINIVGNTVSQAVFSTDISAYSTTTSYARLEIVPTDTNKVAFSYRNNGTGTYHVVAFNVTGSANPTIAGSVFNTTIDTSGSIDYNHGFSLHRRSDNTYIIAGFTTATAISSRILTFDATTNTWAAASTVTSLTPVGTFTSAYGVICGCLSNGTDYNSQIYTLNATGYNTISVYNQTSATTINNTGVNTASGFQIACKYGFNISNTKFALYGQWNTIAGFISGSTTATNLTNAYNNYLEPTIIPFESRPLIVGYDNTGYATTYGFVGGTSSSFGTQTLNGNYFPWGIPSGKHYMYSETANCWLVGQGREIYSLDNNGVVLNEVLISSQLGIKNLVVTQNGKIGIFADAYGTFSGNNNNMRWTNLAGNLYAGISTMPVTSSASLSSATFTSLISSSSSFYKFAIDLVAYGTQSLAGLFLYSSNSSNSELWILNYTGSTYIGSGSTSAATTYYGVPNFAIVKSTPTSWIMVGQQNMNPSTTNAISYSAETNFSSNSTPSTFTILASQGGSSIPYKSMVSRTQSGLNAVALGCIGNGTSYFWVDNSGTLLNSFAGTAVTVGNNQLPTVTSNKSLAFISLNNAAATSISFPRVYSYLSTGLYNLYNGTTGQGWANVYSNSLYAATIYGASINKKITYVGSNSVKLTMTINNGTDDFYITPTSGSTLSGSTNRGTDVYYVPNGYSIKLKSNVENTIDTMLEVLEQ